MVGNCGCEQSLIAGEEFQHILRVLNTNVDGRQKIMFALTSIKGVGRRFANLVCKKADVDMSKRCVIRRFFVSNDFHFEKLSLGILDAAPLTTGCLIQAASVKLLSE